jgi:hypothetical protein
MDLTLAATIIVLVVLTLVIFAFVFVVFRSIQKSEHILVDQGNRDQEIITEKDKQKSKAYKIGNLLTNILSGVIAAFAIAMMAFALYFKFSNNLAFINGQSQMVIASNSMSYVARDAQYATNGGYLTDAMVAQEFKRGDILTVEKPQSEEVFTTLQKDSSGKLITEKSIYGNGYTYVPVQSGVLYEIYGYNNDYSKKLVGNSWNSETSIIIHRLVRIWADGDGNIVLNFAGDAVGGLDDVDVKPSELVAHYPGTSKISGLGYVILFFQSIFGVYAVASSVVMLLFSELYTGKIQKDYDVRWGHIDHSRLVVYDQIQAQRALIQDKWGSHRELLKERKEAFEQKAAEHREEVKQAVEEHHEEVKAKVEEHREEVKAKVAERQETVGAKLSQKKAEAVAKEPAKKKVFGKKGIVVKIVKSDDEK